MNIMIETHDFKRSSRILAFVRRKIGFAFDKLDKHVERIEVRLNDINGPKGGLDKSCRIIIVLPRLKDVVVEDTKDDMYKAVDRAVQRATRAVKKSISRQRQNSRSTSFGSLTA